MKHIQYPMGINDEITGATITKGNREIVNINSITIIPYLTNNNKETSKLNINNESSLYEMYSHNHR